MSNLALAYDGYVAQNTELKSKLHTALIRYTLPKLGFVIPERSVGRLQDDDINLAIEFASQFDLDENIGVRLSEAQEKVMSAARISQDNKRQQRKNLKKFIEFIQSIKEGIKLPSKTRKKNQPSRKTVKNLSHVEAAKSKKKQQPKITLSFKPEDYPGDFASNKRELERIEKELDEHSIFLATIQNSPRSWEETLKVTKRLLGWLYLEKQSLVEEGLNPLTEVGLNQLIPVCNIYPVRGKLSHYEYLDIRYQHQQNAKDKAKESVNFLKNFFIDYGVEKRGAKINYIDALINVAKKQHKGITDEEEYENYEDISVIRRLRILRNKIPKDPKKIELPLPDWKTVGECLEELKRRADLDCTGSGRRKTRLQKAKCLQNFLILGMFVIGAPPRQRVIRELKIGETFKHGSYLDGIFIPRDELSNPEEAMYHIHLQPEDYKTGGVYGEYSTKFEDVTFHDGTTFSQYLDEWIYGGFREEMLKDETHDYLFMKEKKCIPLDKKATADKIRNLFNSTLKQKISPHKLRTIFRTHLENRGASEQEINSFGAIMHHDPKTGRKYYTKQTLDEKLKPAKELLAKINVEMFGSPRTSS